LKTKKKQKNKKTKTKKKKRRETTDSGMKRMKRAAFHACPFSPATEPRLLDGTLDEKINRWKLD